VSTLCSYVGISRQGYYKDRHVRSLYEIREDIILELVRKKRTLHSKMGCRKLHHELRADMQKLGIYIGRDRFFKLMKRHGMLIRRRRKYTRTTDSNHPFRKYPNLFKDVEWEGPNQAWVSDITYIKSREGTMYLSLITDAYSRKIVGYEVNDTLESEGCVKALKRAMKQLSPGELPLHHSDRGLQYCSHAYTSLLIDRGLSISMTEDNHCYENAMAERVNGILKHEYALKESFPNKQIARKACKQAIYLYNTGRPHLALNMRYPEQVHQGRKKAIAYPNFLTEVRGEMCQL